MSDPRIEKLPKWVRGHIADLERKLEKANYEHGKLKATAESGCTGKVKRGYLLSESEVLLPDNDSYTFTIGEDFGIRIRIEKNGDGDEFININAKDTIDIEPRAVTPYLYENT